MNRITMLLVGVLTALLIGCAQDMGTIDRVQDNVVKKVELLYAPDGTRREWYYRSTVVDAPHASAYSFVGMQTKLERGVFDIQEKMLLFYRTYTFTEGEYNKDFSGNDTPREDVDTTLKCKPGITYCDADGKQLLPNCDCKGNYLINGKVVWVSKNAPLLAFPIEKHFDIIWEYNPSTGEKTNVRVENDTDRLWWEREYMRVEWGNLQFINMEHPLMPNILTSEENGSSSSFVFKDTSAAPDVEPRITPAQGYIDYVADVTLGALLAYEPGSGNIPVCWYYPWYSGGIYECVSERIRFRDAFVAVDTQASEQYTPKVYTDMDMLRFGLFRDERLSWNPFYGTTYSGVIRHASLFDIWEKDQNGNIVGVKPIVYNLSEGFNRDYVEEANAVADEYTKVFDQIVKSVTGKDPAEFGVEHMFVMCENNWAEACSAKAEAEKAGIKPVLAQVSPPCVMGPVINDDGTYIEHPTLDQACACRPFVADATCEVSEIRKVNGDFRYSFLYDVQGPSFAAPGGFGPWASDPITGRVLSASAYIYSGYFKFAATRLLDRLELLAGAKSFGQHVNANYINEKVKYQRLRQSSYWKNGYTEEDARKVADALVKPEVATALSAQPPEKTDVNFTEARLSMLSRLPDIEAMLIADDFKMLFKEVQLGEQSQLSSEKLERFALRNWAYSRGYKKFLEYRKKAAENALDLREFYDTALIRLGNLVKKDYDESICAELAPMRDSLALEGIRWCECPPEEPQCNCCKKVPTETNPNWSCADYPACSVENLVERLRINIAYANQQNPFAFEVYSIPTPLETDVANETLRTTQKALKDALAAKRPEWVNRLSKRIFYGIALHEIGHNLGLRHNFEATTDAFNFFPEYWYLKVAKKGDRYEPVTMWGRISDEQAAGGNTLSSFGLRELAYSSVMDYHFKTNSAWAGLGLYDKAALKYAYGDLMEVFEHEPNMEAVVDPETGAKAKDYASVNPASIDPANPDPFKVRGEGFGVVTRRIHPIEYPNLFGDVSKMFARKDVKKSEVLGAPCLIEGGDCGNGKVCKRFYEGLRCSIPQTVVPYRFGGDEMNYGIAGVATFDEGIDPFERAYNVVEVLEQNWVFNGYWHENALYWSTTYANAVQSLYETLRREYQQFVLGYAVYNHNDYWYKKFGKRWEQDLNGGLPGAIAAKTAFDYLAQSFGRPVPTPYGYNNLTKRYEPVDQVNFNNYTNQIMFLAEDGARPMYATWNYEGYLPVVTSSGAIYDRLAALEMLTDPEMYILGVDNMTDNRKYLINFGVLFRDELNDILGGLMANNATKYGWCVITNELKQPLGFGPRPFTGPHTQCDKLYCGGYDNTGRYVTALADYSNPVEPKCPANLKDATLLRGEPIEPEELYIFPTTRFRIPMLAAYYGLALLSGYFDQTQPWNTTFDRTFQAKTRLWIKGSKYAVNIPSNALVARCEDRLSGKIYETYALPDGGYYPAYDLVLQCEEMFSCYDPAKNKGLTDDQKSRCKAWAQSPKAVEDLTLDDLRKDYLFHPLQFLIGKLELIRAMHATYAYADTAYLDPYGSNE